jgi:phenylpropionate dioxygenase-like ring-hydroxylating dioxygenase large terminal subunit
LGALIALEDGGSAENFACVYHAWRYELEGNLNAVAFQNGLNGKGGTPESFCMEEHGPRKLRIATHNGLVFGSMDNKVPSIQDYLREKSLVASSRCCASLSR